MAGKMMKIKVEKTIVLRSMKRYSIIRDAIVNLDKVISVVEIDGGLFCICMANNDRYNISFETFKDVENRLLDNMEGK